MALPLVQTALLAVSAHGLLAPTTRSRPVTISPELEAQILRYHHVEKWRPGTIARQLHVHYGTVARVLAQAGLPRIGPARPSAIDPYLPFILQTLEKFPTLTASRLYAMIRERGYAGGPDHFRHVISRHRPRRKAEAYLRLRTLMAEQSQVDWAHFGKLKIGRAVRPLMAFVMVLSYSRDIYLRFFLNASMENFLRGHVGAFATWRGLPRVLLYDNLKSVVLERVGDAIRFHPTFLDFAGHYRFEPRPVAVARGNEKGRVERAVRFARESFFAARSFVDLDDLNAQAAACVTNLKAIEGAKLQWAVQFNKPGNAAPTDDDLFGPERIESGRDFPRRLLRRRTTGEVIERDRKGDTAWTRFAFPTWWHYDVLRGLDYLRSAGVTPDERVAEAIELVASKRGADGRWLLETVYPGVMPIEMDEGEGRPSRWNTLRALRVLGWYERADS